MSMRDIREASIKGKNVLVRVDFNVPVKDGKVTSDKRIRAAMDTLRLILSKNPDKIILMSHLGRPKGERVPEFSLLPVAKALASRLKRKVDFVDDVFDVDGIASSRSKVVLLENLRFYPEEKKNDAVFAKKLASYGDIYVNDAFGTCHRSHASVDAITRYVPSYPGLLLEKEIFNLDIERAKTPLVVIIGGAKVSDKIGVLKRMVRKADAVLIGGAMMFTFLKAQGYEVGRSLVEDDKLVVAKKLLSSSKNKIMLPVDVAVSRSLKSSTGGSGRKIVDISSLPRSYYGLDIGPETVNVFSSVISKAGTILWNGPMGMFEQKPFHKGTVDIAKAVASSGARSIIGGGDSVSAIEKAKLSAKITHISTGGGASLEFIEGKYLPGLKALER
ncbi:MAG: phosphoglycerate kinase [Candidatus Woesearchaeota archaeon]